MTAAPVVGIAGGRGAVGGAIARHLSACGWQVRIGGRDGARGAAFAADLDGPAEWVFLDCGDSASLDAFCDGCDLIVNCVGPARITSAPVARAALGHGAHYLDTAGHGPNFPDTNGLIALRMAGMYPGLSGLLPRFLADSFDSCHTLSAYIGGCDRLTSAAAADYVDSLSDGFGDSNAAWRDGQRVRHALSGRDAEVVPFFPRPVTLRPYLTTEAEQVARALDLVDVNWYSIFDGTHVLASLPQTQDEQHLAAVIRAAEMDLFGRERYQILLYEMSGMRRGVDATRTMMLKARGGSELTAFAAVEGARAIAEGRIPPGVHVFAETIDPAVVADRLRCATDVVIAFEMFDGPMNQAEQGAL